MFGSVGRSTPDEDLPLTSCHRKTGCKPVGAHGTRAPAVPQNPPLLDVLAELGEQQADGPAGVQPAGLLQGAPQGLGAQQVTEGGSRVHQHHVRDIHLLDKTAALWAYAATSQERCLKGCRSHHETREQEETTIGDASSITKSEQR
jgi:hypothetical protein